jgi:hypothetical protein
MVVEAPPPMANHRQARLEPIGDGPIAFAIR